MLTCAIIGSQKDEERQLIRYEVEVSLPPLYREVVTFTTADVGFAPQELNRSQDAARRFALHVARRNIGHAVQALLGVPEESREVQAPQSRRRRTKAEMGAAQDKEENLPPLGKHTSPQSSTLSMPCDTSSKPGITPEPGNNTHAPEPQTDTHIFRNCPEHEAIVIKLAKEAFGLGWSADAEIVAAVRKFCREAITAQVPAVGPGGEAHPELRLLFSVACGSVNRG
jgi:hypothetical protein